MVKADLVERLALAAWPLAESTVRAYAEARMASRPTLVAMLVAHFALPDAPAGSIAHNMARRWQATLDSAWSREVGA